MLSCELKQKKSNSLIVKKIQKNTWLILTFLHRINFKLCIHSGPQLEVKKKLLSFIRQLVVRKLKF